MICYLKILFTYKMASLKIRGMEGNVFAYSKEIIFIELSKIAVNTMDLFLSLAMRGNIFSKKGSKRQSLTSKWKSCSK